MNNVSKVRVVVKVNLQKGDLKLSPLSKVVRERMGVVLGKNLETRDDEVQVQVDSLEIGTNLQLS